MIPSHSSEADKLATAYHEAGHAAVAHYFGFTTYSLTIVAAEDYMGLHTGENPLYDRNPEWDADADTIARIRAFAIGCLAGREAQIRFDPKSEQSWHAQDDFDRAVDVASYLSSGPGHTQEIVSTLVLETRVLVEKLWPQITRVAQVLFAKKTLSGNDVTKILEIEDPE